MDFCQILQLNLKEDRITMCYCDPHGSMRYVARNGGVSVGAETDLFTSGFLTLKLVGQHYQHRQNEISTEHNIHAWTGN